MNVLVLGYGNPGRQDDAIGPLIADAVEGWALPGVRAASDFQLNIEYAADLAQADAVIFADAAKAGPAPFGFAPLGPALQIAFTTHALDPASLLAVCRDAYGRAPRAFVLGVRAYEFEFCEGLGAAARANLDSALRFLKEWLRRPPDEWPATAAAMSGNPVSHESRE